jgi:hypothetical protein
MAGVLGQRETDGIVGRRVAGVQRGDDIDAGRQGAENVSESSTVTGQEAHARKAKPGGQFARFFDQFRAAFDADRSRRWHVP